MRTANPSAMGSHFRTSRIRTMVLELLMHDRKDDVRGMVLVVEDRVRRDRPSTVVVQRLARVRVDVEPREAAAGNVDADPVPLLEEVRRRVQLDRERVDGP